MCQSREMAVYLFKGTDPALVSDAVAAQVRLCLGDRDRSMVVEEFAGDYSLAAVVDSASTPTFLGDPRIVIAHDVSQHRSDIEVLVDYLENSREDTDVLIDWGSGAVPPRLTAVLKKIGAVTIDPTPPSKAGERRAWWQAQIAAHEVDLDTAAAALVGQWLGEDVARWPRLAESLKSAYGHSRITAELLAPFLGERGDVKPWDLTDALDAGNARVAVVTVRRLMSAGERHALQVLAQLHTHYSRLARLDGANVSTRDDAEEVLGVKGFVADKALKAYRSIGPDGVRMSFELLARADVDLRGGTALDAETVMDVLVARLARLARVSRRS